MRRLVLATLVAIAAGPAVAQPVSLRGAAPIADATLAEVRGGFVSPTTGLSVSFGIERAVYAAGSDAAAALVRAASGSGLLIVQRGAGNAVDIGSLNSAANATLIQNSLDNQKLNVVTTIDVTANSLQVLSAMNLRASVSNAITASLRR